MIWSLPTLPMLQVVGSFMIPTEIGSKPFLMQLGLMTKSLRIEKLIVNVDATDIISLVSNSNSTNRLTWPLVADCMAILQTFH